MRVTFLTPEPAPWWQRERPALTVEQWNGSRDKRAAPLYGEIHLAIIGKENPEQPTSG